MKKNLILLSCIALFSACGGNNSGAEGEEYYNKDRKVNTEETESAAGVAPGQSEVQTAPATTNTETAPATGGGATAANIENGAKLISQSDCLACHQEKQKVVGPAYVDVAKKYEANDKNVNYLAQKVISGGKGVWGQVPMTPHPDLKEEDAKDMVHYILSLNK